MFTIANTTKLQTLIGALRQREREVFDYQINIDNFRLAIAAIDKMPDDISLADYRAQLEQLMASSVSEQRKAQIILDVVLAQLDGQDIPALLEQFP